MSLLVWLPLIDNYENQGSSNLKFTLLSSANTTFPTGGKIGSTSYSNDSYTAGSLISDKTISLGNQLTMCCWVKFNGLMSGSNLGGAMGGQHRYANCTGMGLTFKYISSTTGYLSCNTGDGSGRTYNTYCGNTLLQAGNWYHICFTYDGSYIRFYVNGNFDGSHAYSAQKNTTDKVIVGAWSLDSSNATDVHANYKLYGSMNDFRIYNEVISLKEIKELARGLVAHYKLDHPDAYNLAYNSPLNIYDNYGVSKSLQETGEKYRGAKVYRLTMAPTASSLANMQTTLHSHGVYQGSYQFLGGQKYCYWIYFKPVTHNDVRVGGVASNYHGWTEIPPQRCSDGWYRVGQYRDGTASTVTDNIYTSFYTPTAVVGGLISIDFCYPHLYAGTSEIGAETLYEAQDGSGYNNHLEADGIFNYTTSPKHLNAIDFNQTGYLTKSNFNLKSEQFTIAFWLNPKETYNAQHFLLGTFNSWTGNGLGIWRDAGTKNSYSFLVKSDSASSHSSFSWVPASFGSWHHIAFVYTGEKCSLYVNGEIVQEYTYGNKGLVSHPVLYLGKSLFNSAASQVDQSSISDFRYYATALSKEDIQELRSSNTMLSRDGTLFALDFTELEVFTQSVFLKRGLVQTGNFCDVNLPLQEMRLKALEDGSTWARIHYLDVSSKQTYFTPNEVQRYNGTNRYSSMKDVDKFKSAPSLPGNYEELEYLQSSGTQFINTGFKPNNDTRIVIKAQLKTSHSIYGVTETNKAFNMTGNASGMYFYWAGRGQSLVTNYYNQTHVYEQDGNRCLVDGQIYHNYTSDSWQSNYEIFLFGRNSSSGLNDAGTVQIYFCQIYDKDKLIRNYVPCKNTSNNTLGMYDLVENKFYSNSGSGTFSSGNFVKKYEFMLTYPLLSSTEYNRWSQTSSPNNSSVSDYQPIHIAWPQHSAGIRTHGTDCVYNCDSGDTWYAPIGQKVAWSGGIPAADGSAQLKTELWVRTDKAKRATQLNIHLNSINANNFIEI